MAKQIGLIKIKGSIDDLNFYEGQDGKLVRKKARFSADKLKNHPNYAQVRNVNAEFGTGGNAATIFRDAFTAEITRVQDTRMNSRLLKAMISVLQTDLVNEWGYRQVQVGDMSQLVNFNFNDSMSFASTVKAKPVFTFNRTTGAISITIPAHVPLQFVAAPSNATHYKFFAAAAFIDFDGGQSTSVRQTFAGIPYDNNQGTPIELAMQLTPNSPLPLFVVLGVEFSKLVNGKQHPNSKKESALTILAVDAPEIEEEP